MIRNAHRNADGVGIDCEVNHPVFGWIPFTARPDDPEDYGRAIYEMALERHVEPPKPGN